MRCANQRPRYRRSRSVSPASSCASDGHTYARADRTLGEHVPRITDRLTHWATVAPERISGASRTERRWHPR